MEIRHDLTEDTVSEFFMSDPRLSYIGLDDDSLVYMYNNQRYKAKENTVYAGVYDEDELICIFRWELFTPITVGVHLYLKSRLHKSDIFTKISKMIIDFYRDKSSFKKLLVFAPGSCVHVHKAAKRVGFEEEAIIKKCLIWRKELVDLHIFSLEL